MADSELVLGLAVGPIPSRCVVQLISEKFDIGVVAMVPVALPFCITHLTETKWAYTSGIST